MTNALLTLEQEDQEGISLIRVVGPLDSVTHDQFRDYLDPLVNKPHARIVLDCTGLQYVNSRGLTLLARYQRTLSSSLAFLGIAGLNPRILKAIELLGMTKLVRLYPSVEEACSAAVKL
ncbi:MAG: STAS domain-containing protein [Kiritimatiellae bacterium]|jgi:anti-anti-sigma factor|nr:STAS domain-containing protein [Kiritimatiellia bacterium]MDY0149616.1 STAS domain-containing protein [Kiritimatiellia bacterium]